MTKLEVPVSMPASMSVSGKAEIAIRRHLKPGEWTYELLNQRQIEIADRVRSGGSGAILLSEVAPVITVGRRTPECDLLMNEEMLAKMGISRIQAERGGFATYHGPGQWVLFVVDSLERLTGDTRGVRKAVDRLLEIARLAASHAGVKAECRAGTELGLWSDKGKVAALGIQIEQGVLLHGISLNGYRTPQSFQGLRPCGLDTPVDFLLSDSPKGQEQINEQKFEALGKTLVQAALQVFWN
jgi:lipoate-protein ligase B